MARLSIKLRCQYRRYWTLGRRPQASRRWDGMIIGLLHQNVLNLPKMRHIAMGWDQDCTVTSKCSKSPKKRATFMRVWSTIVVASFCYDHTFPKNVQHFWGYGALKWLHTFATFIRSLKMCHIFEGMEHYSGCILLLRSYVP